MLIDTKVSVQVDKRDIVEDPIIVYSLLFRDEVVFMVIQSMRFIDNGRTVPQVLKAFSVNPFFEPSNLEGCTLSPVHSWFFPRETMMPPSCSWISIARKKSHLSIVFRVTGWRARRREIEREEKMRKKVKEGGIERERKQDSSSGRLARAGYALHWCCKTCLLREFFLSYFILPRIKGRGMLSHRARVFYSFWQDDLYMLCHKKGVLSRRIRLLILFFAHLQIDFLWLTNSAPW